jgi:hypothetical protein
MKQNEEKWQKGRLARKMKNRWNWKVKVLLDREKAEYIEGCFRKEMEVELKKKSIGIVEKGILKREEKRRVQSSDMKAG